jgi:hypothetical protein
MYEITTIIADESNFITFPACCIDCKTPSIIGDLYEDQLFIAFTCDMPDGTRVAELITGGVGVIYDGMGVIELNKKLKAGNVVKLQVSDPICKAISSHVIVKSKDVGCVDCGDDVPCYIRITDIKTSVTGSLATITLLNTESSGVIAYRLDSGEWVDTIEELGTLTVGVGHTIGLKDKNNPICRMEHPMLVLHKIITVPI